MPRHKAAARGTSASSRGLWLGLVTLLVVLFLFMHGRPSSSDGWVRATSVQHGEAASSPRPLLFDESTEFLYFAYASDLLEERIRAGGGPSARKISIGKVSGRRFLFSQESKVWKGGVGDLVPASADESVWGVVYKLKRSDEPGMDKQKGVNKDDPLYEKLQVLVEMPDGESVSAVSYGIVAAKRVPGGVEPSPQYKSCILNGAQTQRLPKEYIASIKRIPDNGSTYRRKNVC